MLIYPAVDLMNGRCVRLRQGDFSDLKVYTHDPLEQCTSFERLGAKYLHLVDLDGARDPSLRQVPLLKTLMGAIRPRAILRPQVGGGIRTLDEMQALLDLGFDRVVVGSLCVENPELIAEAGERFGIDRLTLGLDVTGASSQEPYVTTKGWTSTSRLSLNEAMEKFRAMGFFRFLITDVERDGLMKGPNVALYLKLRKDFPHSEIQASGGVSNLADLASLRDAGVHSVIIGKALYEGAFTFEQALKVGDGGLP